LQTKGRRLAASPHLCKTGSNHNPNKGKSQSCAIFHFDIQNNKAKLIVTVQPQVTGTWLAGSFAILADLPEKKGASHLSSQYKGNEPTNPHPSNRR
jgi:hypothetical protein